MSEYPPSLPLRLLTVNIHKGYSAFNCRFVLHELREAVHAVRSDLVFLQEVEGASGSAGPGVGAQQVARMQRSVIRDLSRDHPGFRPAAFIQATQSIRLISSQACRVCSAHADRHHTAAK
jgi:endonuclease/exonuclease/phosphatase family metal-dependent hydrolase